MTYCVEMETHARREYLGLPDEVAERIAAALEDLQADPRPPGARKLGGQEGCRIRKGDYRVLYTVGDRDRRVRVYRIGRRREVYRR